VLLDKLTSHLPITQSRVYGVVILFIIY